MNSREIIDHPGPASAQAVSSARGDVQRLSAQLKAGENLMQAIGRVMDAVACDSGMILLDGLLVGPFNYVMPSHSNDDVHVAWYSATHACDQSRLQMATATVGRRDDAWWMHCHACWAGDGVTGMGHLLPDEVTITEDATVTLYAFSGGVFNVELDAETAFPIFHVDGDRDHGNALIARVSPHADIYTVIEELVTSAGYEHAAIYGLGSLIGAQFEGKLPMESPISEVLIPSGASWDGALNLPVRCIDTSNGFFSGKLIKGGAPVLITFELMVVDQSESIGN